MAERPGQGGGRVNRTQDEVFRAGEADRWFERNRAALTDERAARDPVLRSLAMLGARRTRVLEVGAANGWRVAVLLAAGSVAGVAVELSEAAIADGRQRNPSVEFRQGQAADLPLAPGERFDLVIASFVLHWVDRRTLLRVAAELDRAVEDGGLLVIADFLPDEPARVPYHHLPESGVYTFKQDYGALFVASRLYRELARTTFHHASLEFQAGLDGRERCAVIVLERCGVGGYRDLAGL